MKQISSKHYRTTLEKILCGFYTPFYVHCIHAAVSFQQTIPTFTLIHRNPLPLGTLMGCIFSRVQQEKQHQEEQHRHERKWFQQTGEMVKFFWISKRISAFKNFSSITCNWNSNHIMLLRDTFNQVDWILSVNIHLFWISNV